MDAPEYCIATLTTRPTLPGVTGPTPPLPRGTLPRLGEDLPPWLLLAALALLALGLIAVAVAAARRHRALSAMPRERTTPTLALLAAAGLGLGLALAPVPGAPARAESEPDPSTSVVYSDGCRLFDLGRIEVSGDARSILPGVDTALLTVDVTNRLNAPVTLSAATELATAHPGLDVITPVHRFSTPGGGADRTRLDPGSTSELVVSARTPASLGNEAQGGELELSVIITAEEAPRA